MKDEIEKKVFGQSQNRGEVSEIVSDLSRRSADENDPQVLSPQDYEMHLLNKALAGDEKAYSAMSMAHKATWAFTHTANAIKVDTETPRRLDGQPIEDVSPFVEPAKLELKNWEDRCDRESQVKKRQR